MSVTIEAPKVDNSLKHAIRAAFGMTNAFISFEKGKYELTLSNLSLAELLGLAALLRNRNL